MKYLVLLVVLFGVSACSKPDFETQYVCLNPFASMQALRVDLVSPNMKVKAQNIEITTDEGLTVLIPKSLCAEIRKPVGW